MFSQWAELLFLHSVAFTKLIQPVLVWISQKHLDCIVFAPIKLLLNVFNTFSSYITLSINVIICVISVLSTILLMNTWSYFIILGFLAATSPSLWIHLVPRTIWQILSPASNVFNMGASSMLMLSNIRLLKWLHHSQEALGCSRSLTTFL
jgi:hypothetical protein